MHLKMQPEMVVIRARPKQTIKDHLLHQSTTVQSDLVPIADLLHQSLITMVARLIINTKDPQAVVGVIAAAECVAEALVAGVASAASVKHSPSAQALEAGEAGEAEVALKAATNHST